VQALSDAKRTILVQAYSFTSAPIAKALLDAHTRDVQVQVILDKSQRTEQYSSADFLANQHVLTMSMPTTPSPIIRLSSSTDYHHRR
jgi:phosphatidylserine/phosphatidylglycerophosphate/cardiolipin synthase-like enzyme